MRGSSLQQIAPFLLVLGWASPVWGWDHFGVNKPHLAYAILGGFVTIFSLLSLFIKEKLYIGEATVATIVGIIFGPHCLNLFAPETWGNVDQITLELTRIVLIVQIFAVGVELPKKYMKRHWVSVAILLLPVMTFGWLISSLFMWALLPKLNFAESLAVAACITATDPVLASSVVGKGKFAKRVPGHLRNLLSAESGCNDGMAFPFLYLALYIILDEYKAGPAIRDWILLTILYEVVFGCALGAFIGYVGRQSIKYAENHNLIDRESFLVFYFVLSMFCAGAGTLLGTDDLLVAFSAGTAFAWDGWFSKKTEESHVSNVIDLLLNLSLFVYFGAIVPWESFNAPALGVTPWRLVVISILILLFRRIPAILALKPFIPDIKTWREALFCGHFGPIGVGAIFISILARAELEHGHTTPLATLPSDPNSSNYISIQLIWPVTSFIVLASIIVHGSSIAVYTLGTHINTLSITMTMTRDNTTTDNPTWLNRLPRIEVGQSVSLGRDEDGNGMRLRRKNSRSRSRRGVGGRVDESAIGRGLKPGDAELALGSSRSSEDRRDRDRDGDRDESDETLRGGRDREGRTEEDREEEINNGNQVFREGADVIIEDENGEIVHRYSEEQTGALHEKLSDHVPDPEERKQAVRDPGHPKHGVVQKILGMFRKEGARHGVSVEDLRAVVVESTPTTSRSVSRAEDVWDEKEENEEEEYRHRGRGAHRRGSETDSDSEKGESSTGVRKKRIPKVAISGPSDARPLDDTVHSNKVAPKLGSAATPSIIVSDRRNSKATTRSEAKARADREKETPAEARRRMDVLRNMETDEVVEEEKRLAREAFERRQKELQAQFGDEDTEKEEDAGEESGGVNVEGLRSPTPRIRFGGATVDSGELPSGLGSGGDVTSTGPSRSPANGNENGNGGNNDDSRSTRISFDEGAAKRLREQQRGSRG
ncbi:hypothetical protein SAICODRAFT_17588 [Saitoella complicata NRRL Y-17804]|nr:uncharacterized protein SAICODRAFT_17588 [Saitoella complicata NRRL Y-17804]ODQ55191.1 hypothetical protein SAICODRAFT_17588 [Saitoella complicata NRRL Y-17804]